MTESEIGQIVRQALSNVAPEVDLAVRSIRQKICAIRSISIPWIF